MPFYLKLSLRNLKRNRRRNLVTITGTSLGVAAMLIYLSFVHGWVEKLETDATSFLTGDLQIHAPEYVKDRSIYRVIEGPGAILERLDPGRYAATLRSRGYTLLSTGEESSGSMIFGLDPEKEKSVTLLHERVKEGDFLGPGTSGSILLGNKLASSLEAGPGDEVIAVGQARDGSLANSLFIVSGVLLPVSEEIDRAGAFITLQDFDELFVMEGAVHEVVIRTKGESGVEEAKGEISLLFPDLEVEDWRGLMPQIAEMLDLMDAANYLLILVLYLAVGFVIMNTILMSVFERIREIGLLRATGLSRFQILKLVLSDSLVFSLTGMACGTILASPFIYLLITKGIDLSFIGGGFSAGEIYFDPVSRGTLNLRMFLDTYILVIIIPLLSSIYPAMKAWRMEPSRALTFN